MQYFVESVQVKTSSRGSDYVEVNLNDGTTRQKASCWSMPHAAGIKAKTFISATVEEKNGFYNVVPASIRLLDVNEVNNVQFAHLMLTSPVTYEMFLAQFEAAVLTLPLTPNFKKFFDLFNWEEFLKSYAKVPAALHMHHDMPNGLFMHMSEMLEIYMKIAETKWASSNKHEYVLLGIVFHDYGKIMNYDIENYQYNYSTPLLGHIYISAHYLENILTAYNSQANPEDQITHKQLAVAVHCVLAHHRNKEWGSPVVPATKEAMILHFIDDLSGKGNMYDKATEMESVAPLQTSVIKDYE